MALILLEKCLSRRTHLEDFSRLFLCLLLSVCLSECVVGNKEKNTTTKSVFLGWIPLDLQTDYQELWRFWRMSITAISNQAVAALHAQ